MTTSASRRRPASALALGVIGSLVVPAVLATSTATAATPNSGRVGPYRFASATGACTSTSGAVTGIAVPSVSAAMYPKWYRAAGPNHTRIGAQYVRTQVLLSAQRNGVWSILGLPLRGKAVAVNRTAKQLPAAAPFTGERLPAGYDAYRVIQQVIWYSPRNPNAVDGTATRTLTAYTAGTATQPACLPAPAALSTVTATATPTSFAVALARPSTPYAKAVTVRWARGTTAPAGITDGTAAPVSGSKATVTGLRPATAYSYSAWVVDTAGQLSAPVTGTVTTSGQPPVTATGVAKAVSVSAGSNETCAVSSAGALTCWGAGDRGQLGTGATTGSSTAVPVATGISAVSVGGDFACAVTTAGKALCWGADDHGQLGDGGTADRGTPQEVAGLSDVLQISAGATHACALTKAALGRTVYCWGSNSHGELGDGTTTDRPTPVQVVGGLGLLETYSSVTSGASHSCATTSAHGVLCWGDNAAGELGDGSTTSSTTPVRLDGLTSDLVSAGAAHTCALLTDGTASCWGSNADGALGDGTTVTRTSPVAVSGVTSAVALVGTGSHTCAVLSAGGVTCWGENYVGQLGDGSWEPALAPVTVASVSGATGVATGSGHSCAVLGDGTVRCWGSDAHGQLGDS